MPPTDVPAALDVSELSEPPLDSRSEAQLLAMEVTSLFDALETSAPPMLGAEGAAPTPDEAEALAQRVDAFAAAKAAAVKATEAAQ